MPAVRRVVLCSVALLALSGCSGKGDGSSQSPSPSTAGGTQSGSGATGSGTSSSAPAISDSAADYAATAGPRLTVRGRNFVSGSSILLGATPCTDVTFVSSGELSCKIPSLAVGSYDIVVVDPTAVRTVLAAAFQVFAAPLVSAISPATGAAAGGTAVTITGSGFRAGAQVQIGAVACDGVTVVSATEIRCTAGAAIAGQYTVYVRNVDTLFGGITNAFTSGAPNTWVAMTATTTVDSLARDGVWTGNGLALISKGFYSRNGSSVSVYTPNDDKWTQLTTGGTLPDNRSLRSYGTVLVTGKLFMWGGFTADPPNCTGLNSGGVFDLANGAWKKTLQGTNTPFGRSYPTVVAAGAQVIVWGGLVRNNCTVQASTGGAAAPAANNQTTNSGGIYDMATDTWKAMSTTNAPAARYFPAAVWTGTKLVVWGGYSAGGTLNPLNDGGIYDLATNTWTKMSQTNAPEKRGSMNFAWTGTKLLVFGGLYAVDLGNGTFGETIVGTGGVYDLATDTWTAMSATGRPSARGFGGSVWTGARFLVFGGRDSTNIFNNGAGYDPAANAWSGMSATGSVGARIAPTAVWSGSRVMFWGGSDNNNASFTNAASYIP